MNRGLLLLVPVLALGGCFEAAPEQSLLSIDGELRIELPVPAANEAGIKPEVFVFLGDGTRHFERLGENGRVVFSDTSLRGPQDITVVSSHPNSGGESPSRLDIYTALEVNRRETYLKPLYQPSSQLAAGTISGRVTGISDDPNAFVEVRAYVGNRSIGWAGSAVHGTPFPEGVFEFSMDLASKPDGEVYLVANEMSGSTLSTQRTGIIKDVAIGASGQASIEIPVSAFTTEKVLIDVGEGPREGVRGSVVISAGGNAVLRTNSERGGFPVEVSAIPLEGAWSGFSRFALLEHSLAGAPYRSCAAVPLGNATSARIDMLEFPVITTPSFPLSGEPVTVPAAEPFAMTWRSDPRATAIGIYLSSEEAGSTNWRIDAPASRKAFSLQPLPEALAHLNLEMKGQYSITIASLYSERIATYSERFMRRSEEVDGCAPFEGGSQSHAVATGRFTRE